MLHPILLGLLVPVHMLGGIRASTAAYPRATSVVLGQVVQSTPLSQGAWQVKVNVVANACGVPRQGTLDVFQLADHAVTYRPGQRAVFPLLKLEDSPHKVPDVPAQGLLVEQAAHEVVTFDPGEEAALTALVTRLCGAGRQDALVDALVSPWSTLAGGAALELSGTDAPNFGEPGKAALRALMLDRTRPMSLRITAVNVAGRTWDDALLKAMGSLVVPWEPPEMVAAALRAGPPLSDAALVLVLMGPVGPQRVLAARMAGRIRSDAFVAPLMALALGPEPTAAKAACDALAQHPGRGPEARRRLTRLLPTDVAQACAQAL